MLWSFDAQPETKKRIAQEIETRWVPFPLLQMLPAASHATAAMDPGLHKHLGWAGGSTAEGMGHPTPLGAGGGRAGDGEMPTQSKYILSRHDVGRWVIIDLSFKRDAKGNGKREDTAPPPPAHVNPDTCSQMHTHPPPLLSLSASLHLSLHARAGPNTVLAKLRKHQCRQLFKVQMQAGQSDRDLVELDFSRLDYMLVATHPPAAQIGAPPAGPGAGKPALVGGWPQREEIGAARASASGGGESAAAKAHAASIDFSKDLDIDGFRQYAEQASGVAIKSTALHRLHNLMEFIHRANAPVEELQTDQNPENNCVLGFSRLEVKQPEFNNEIRELIKTSKLWHGLSGSRELKKPTWVVYELLREIGVRPQKHFRGPKEHDPCPKDFMYATRYFFCKKTLLKHRYRLQVLCCTLTAPTTHTHTRTHARTHTHTRTPYSQMP